MSEPIRVSVTLIDPATTAASSKLQAEVPADIEPGKSHFLSRNLWAVVDQGIVSLGNFGTTVFLARALSPESFGDFVLLLNTIVFSNNVHRTLICYPLTIEAAKQDRCLLGELTQACLLFTAGLSVMLALPVLIVGLLAHAGSAIFWALAALICWQSQETVRRALLSQFRYSEVIWGDCISYIGQVAGVVALGYSHQLSSATGFACIAITSLAAALVQAKQIRLLRPSAIQIKSTAKLCWKLGKWASAGEITGSTTTLAPIWVLAAISGPVAAGIFQALNSLLRAVNPISLSAQNVIVPTVAHAIETGDRRGWRVATNFAMQGSAILTPYFLVLLLAGHQVLSLVYGNHSPYASFTRALSALVIAYAVIYVTQLVLAVLNGAGKTKLVFWGQLVALVVMIALGIPLVSAWGIEGACLALLVSFGSMLVLISTHLYRLQPWHEKSLSF